MSDSDDIRFRDQCAIQIMQALLARKSVDGEVNMLIENSYPDCDPDIKKYSNKRIHHLALMSYKIADMMRKARLATFE